VDPFFSIVEQRIEQAERDGLFANLPGRGRPLQLDDLSGVPEELRASYILLKTHGFVPPELEARREWLRLRDLLAACADTGERPALHQRMQRAWLRYRLLMEQACFTSAWLEYQDALLDRLDR
jgi:hypothetical protein